jgi:hypothetical protein
MGKTTEKRGFFDLKLQFKAAKQKSGWANMAQ